MSEFLNAIKVDLLDSRRRPILAALVVAFVAALAPAAGALGAAPVPATIEAKLTPRRWEAWASW